MPAGVALVVVIAMVLVQDVHPCAHVAGVNNAPAPAGSPATEEGENESASAEPLLVLVAVMTLVLPVVAPCTTEILGGTLARVKAKGGVAVIESGKVVVLPNGPLSVTVMVRGAVVTGVPRGTAKESTMSLAHEEPTVGGGVHEVGAKDAVTPAGSPVTLLGRKETADGVPDTVVTCMV